MKYTEEVIRLELMRLMGFSEREAQITVDTYRCNGELNDLAELIEVKNRINGGSQ